MNTNEISLTPVDNRKGRRPGEHVEFSALWALEKKPTTVEARLFWFTRGKGTEDVGVIATQAVPSADSAGEHLFRFTLPEAPYSFSGKLISLLWAVELVASDDVVRCEFDLAPEGREIVLTSAPHAARP
jgi:hypothetical protein